MFTLLEFEEVASTSSLLKEHFSSFPHFTVIRTDYQTQGRGQFDRTWDANPGENLLMSFLLKDIAVDRIEYVKQRTLTVLMDVLNDYGINVRFKAPNDLYVDEHKICGILIETKAIRDILEYAVVGIGLNVNQMTFGEYHATSMSKLLKRSIDLKVLFYDVFIALENEFLKGV